MSGPGRWDGGPAEIRMFKEDQPHFFKLLKEAGLRAPLIVVYQKTCKTHLASVSMLGTTGVGR